jgi:hypothetical protein
MDFQYTWEWFEIRDFYRQAAVRGRAVVFNVYL